MVRILHFLIAAVGYYLIGTLSSQLAIPPGFASAVWPASGFILACYLSLNRASTLFGVGIAAFLVNVSIASQGFTNIDSTDLLLASMIAVGTMLQVVVGGYLYFRLIGKQALVESISDIVKFGFIVGPVGCVMAASFGVLALWGLGNVPAANLPFTWLTWWAGDTIGVSLFTPLLLTLFTSRHRIKLSRKILITLPTTIVFSLILVLFFSSTERQREKREEEFISNSERMASTIKAIYNEVNTKIQAFEAFYLASSNVTLNEFQLFSKTILNGDTIFQALSWTESVSAAERDGVEQRMQREGYPDFEITARSPSGEMVRAPILPEYFPVMYIYPLQTNRSAFGFALASVPERLELLKLSRLTQKTVATPPIRLVQETEEQSALIIYSPVYRPNGLFLGFIGGVVRVEATLSDIVSEGKKIGIGLSIKDISNPIQPISVFQSELSPSALLQDVEVPLLVANRQLLHTFFSSSNLDFPDKDWTSWIILAGGFSFAALLNAFILLITASTENIRNEVERKTLDLELAKKTAEEASKAKSYFLANMSHEFRTPLNAIIGLNDLCLRTGLSVQQENYLRNAQLASRTLMSLINDTLDFAKIESGKLQIEAIEFSVVDLLEKLNAIFSTQAIQQEIDFSVTTAQTMPEYLIGDPLRLEQILLNLCSNAFKFTPKGKVELNVLLMSYLNSVAKIRFSVIDSGIGIATEKQGQLFESFQQADTSTARKYGGSGLGLTISRQLADLMGGSIAFTSTENEGSCFWIEIEFKTLEGHDISNAEFNTRLTRYHVESTEQANTTELVSNAVTSPLNERLGSESNRPTADTEQPFLLKKILLVEDKQINQLIAKEILVSLGAHVTIAGNGIEALELVEKADVFDLILMDIQMPEMDGYEATKEIRKLTTTKRSVPILAMTANAMSEDVLYCKAAGMDDHIAKPLDIDEMIKKISKYI